MQESGVPTLPERHKWRRFFLWLIPLMGLFLAGGWYLAAGPWAGDAGLVKPFTVLALGADERPGSPGRSDSMMLVSFDSAAYRVRVLSIPRDTWYRIPGHGWDKINHAYAKGRETLSVKAVGELLALNLKSNPDLDLETASLSGQGRWIGGGYYLELDLFEARKTAYRFLRGEEPGPDYLAAARKAANQYHESVARALARVKPATPEGQPPGEARPGETPESGEGAGPDSTNTTEPGPSLSLRVVDASGRNVGPGQAARLTAAGFRVLQLVTGDKIETQTVLIIHDNTPESGDLIKKLQQMFPTATLVTAPDQGYPAQAEVILGKDLAPPPL